MKIKERKKKKKKKKEMSDTQFLKYDILLINIHVLGQKAVQNALPHQTSHLAASRDFSPS